MDILDFGHRNIMVWLLISTSGRTDLDSVDLYSLHQLAILSTDMPTINIVQEGHVYQIHILVRIGARPVVAGSLRGPTSSILSALLQIDLDQSTTETATHHPTNVTNLNASLSDAGTPDSHRILPGLGIGIAPAHIYVISPADRLDRREQMEFHRTIQGLTWTVVGAIPGNASLVRHILDRVTLQRAEGKKTGAPGFRWPEEINAYSASHAPLTSSGSDTWVDTSPHSKQKTGKSGPLAYASLSCAIEDDSIPTFTNSTPAWIVL